MRASRERNFPLSRKSFLVRGFGKKGNHHERQFFMPRPCTWEPTHQRSPRCIHLLLCFLAYVCLPFSGLTSRRTVMVSSFVDDHELCALHLAITLLDDYAPLVR